MKAYAYSCKTPRSEGDWEEISQVISSCEKGSLVCLPEYFLDGKEPYQGTTIFFPQFKRLISLVREHEVYLATGMVELDKSGKYIAGILFSPAGDIMGKQRKLNPTSFEKKNGIKAGKERKVISSYFGKVSFSMCKDQWYPDLSIDADVVIHPRGFGLNNEKYGRFYDNWKMLDRTTAMMKKAYLIGTTGADGDGVLSDIVDFEGNLLAEGNGLVSAELDLEKLAKYRSGDYQSKTVARF